jgi:hypothetical protein
MSYYYRHGYNAPHIDWTPADGGNPEYKYALFSRGGFKSSVEEAADSRDNLQLFELDDIVDALEAT